jgi:MFS superfamily sulfate permease-like transporter
VAYVAVLQMPPFGVLFAFGACMLVCGLYYKTPLPVQPMKAIGATVAAQAVQTATVTPDAVYVAALVTGLVWLALGLTGAHSRVARFAAPAVVAGVVLGLGLAFMLEGIMMMRPDWLLAVAGGVSAILLLRNRVMPAMFALLALGIAVGAYQRPDVLSALLQSSIELPTPTLLPLAGVAWSDVFVGAVLLALPQIPLTLGNAIVAITHENNRLFPQAPVTEKTISISTGLMNVFSSCVGGVPMCHGAGGMAGHVAFGARTGGSIVILGGVLLAVAFFFSESAHLIFSLFPTAILGIILFLAGAHLALGANLKGLDRGERFVVVVTAGFCLWNVAIGAAVGMALQYVHKRKLLFV